MQYIEREDKKAFEEQLAEMLKKVPENKKEVVVAHLMGTIQGVLISSDMQCAS